MPPRAWTPLASCVVRRRFVRYLGIGRSPSVGVRTRHLQDLRRGYSEARPSRRRLDDVDPRGAGRRKCRRDRRIGYARRNPRRASSPFEVGVHARWTNVDSRAWNTRSVTGRSKPPRRKLGAGTSPALRGPSSRAKRRPHAEHVVIVRSTLRQSLPWKNRQSVSSSMSMPRRPGCAPQSRAARRASERRVGVDQRAHSYRVPGACLRPSGKVRLVRR